MLISNKIRIEAIQETHIPYDMMYARNLYKFITTEVRIKRQAAKIWDIPSWSINPNTRCPTKAHWRYRKNRPQNPESNADIQRIISTKSNQINICAASTILVSRKQEHCELAHERIEAVPKTHMSIWRADANGQLGNKEQDGPKMQKIIGQIATVTKTEKGVG